MGSVHSAHGVGCLVDTNPFSPWSAGADSGNVDVNVNLMVKGTISDFVMTGGRTVLVVNTVVRQVSKPTVGHVLWDTSSDAGRVSTAVAFGARRVGGIEVETSAVL